MVAGSKKKIYHLVVSEMVFARGATEYGLMAVVCVRYILKILFIVMADGSLRVQLLIWKLILEKRKL